MSSVEPEQSGHSAGLFLHSLTALVECYVLGTAEC